jgi:hypothetical protein
MELIISLWNNATDSTHYAALALCDRLPGALSLIAAVLETLGHTLYEDGTISR